MCMNDLYPSCVLYKVWWDVTCSDLQCQHRWGGSTSSKAALIGLFEHIVHIRDIMAVILPELPVLLHAKTFASHTVHSAGLTVEVNFKPDPRRACVHLVPLQLKEVVEIVGVEGRAQLRRAGGLAEVEIRVGRVGLGSEGVEGAGLVGVLQGEVDPVEELRGLVHGGTRVYGRQQAHLSTQMGQTGSFSTAGSRDWSQLLASPPLRSRSPGRWQQLLGCRLEGPCPVLLTPGASSQSDVSLQSLRGHVSMKSSPHGPLSAFNAADQHRLLGYGMRTPLRHWARRPISVRCAWMLIQSQTVQINSSDPPQEIFVHISS